MTAIEEQTIELLVAQAWESLDQIKSDILNNLKEAVQFWKVIDTHGTPEDKSKLKEYRVGPMELTALIAEDKLALEMVDAGPDSGTLFLMANVLCVQDQKRLLEEGKLTLHFRNAAGQPDRRNIPLDCIKKNELLEAVDISTKKLKTKEEQLKPSTPAIQSAARSTKTQPTNPLYPQGPIKFEERGGKNSKVLTAKVKGTYVTPDYLASVLQTLTADKVRSGRPTQRVELKLTKEELEKAEKVVEQSNGKFKDVADYCRQRLLAYGAI